MKPCTIALSSSKTKTMQSRNLPVDIMRGITIFFMIIVNTPGSWSHVYPPLLHAKWHGCTPTDLVFPFFIFIVGVSMSFSFSKYRIEDRHIWVKKILKRTALIFLIGLLLNWFPFVNKNICDLRIFGVLQRIALAFGGAGLLILFLRKQRPLVLVVALLLVIYWGLLYFFGGHDPYSLASNICTKIDVMLFGENHVYKGFGIPFDPEGLVSTLPGIAHVIIGYLIGKKVQEHSTDKKSLSRTLLIIGMTFIGLGLIWNLFLPINKPLWTSSYVLLTSGLAIIFLLLLTWLIDIKEWKNWAFGFKVFGLNPLISYALSIVIIKVFIDIIKIGDTNLYGWLYENIFQNIISFKFGSFLQALVFTGLIWLFALYLYKKDRIIKL